MMDKDNSQRMRMSLPPGTKVCGEKATYVVKNFICMSARSNTVLCESLNGKSYRLKLYNGQHNMNSAIQERISTVVTNGVVLPVDIGVFGGCPFAVYQNISATDTSKYPIAQNILVQRIIPQLAYVVNKYHQSRILLRDICPEHVLYRVQEQQILYCGFNNMVGLPDRATITKEAGYGQHHSFIAPEVPKYGYSTCSDYYALGVTLLSMVLGKNPMETMSWEDIQKNLFHGVIPGIDVKHLRNTPYELYSEEDKVLYLVLGLMLPNPKDRWGYGELRCWCNNQHIPLTRKEGRIPYQYDEPFVTNNAKCWNYKQLAQGLAADKSSWSELTFNKLNQFANRQKIGIWNKILDANKNVSLTASGKIFRCIYGINPALDGLWWEGKKYANTNELIREAASDPKAAYVLASILKNQSLSYFLKMRKKVSNVNDAEICEMEQIEQWEIAEPGKGVNRCVMRFSGSAQSRSFWLDGIEYQNIDQLLTRYSTNGLKLKNVSASVLKNKSFQAWLWANGMEEMGTKAQEICIAHPEQSFYLLLKIAENASKTDDARKLVRKLYLAYGDYAPIYWLSNRVGDYKMVSIGDQILYDTFKNAGLSLTESIDKLSSKARCLVPDYQHFVSRTAEKPLVSGDLDLEFAGFSFYPTKKDQFFSCIWDNNLEVCPAFLKSIGESI